MSKEKKVEKIKNEDVFAHRQDEFADQGEYLAAKKEFLAKKGKK
jgi:hypothetical protein